MSFRKDPDLKILILIQEGNLAEIERWLSIWGTEVTGQYGNTPLHFAAKVRIHISAPILSYYLIINIMYKRYIYDYSYINEYIHICT